ncbi:glycosyltransferase [Hyperthermus butylicus]|nr:glycosyltransferase [Hyperthermus butylicus]
MYTGVVGFSSYFPPNVRSCSELLYLRRKAGRMLGWSTYILASLKKYGSRFDILYSIIPSLCQHNRYTIRSEFGVNVDIVEFPVRRIVKNIYDYKDYNAIVSFISNINKEELIIYTHNLFSLNFAYELLIFFSKLKKINKNITIVAHQHSQPPFKYYSESLGKLKGSAIGVAGEFLFKLLHKYIDGYVVSNKKTFHYLVDEMNIDPSTVLYQHVGVDYENVNPAKYRAYMHIVEEKVWKNCDYRLVLVSKVTRNYGGYVKGVDLVPHVVSMLRKLGYRACIAVIGEILDKELALKLKSTNGIILTDHLPRDEVFKIVASSDLYILPARSNYYYGGIGVAVIEALALNIPVVSPTLEHVPDERVVKYLGVKAKWVDTAGISRFVRDIVHALDNITQFRPRQYSIRFYDIRIMVNNLEKLFTSLTRKI